MGAVFAGRVCRADWVAVGLLGGVALGFFCASGFPQRVPLAAEFQQQMQPWRGVRPAWTGRRDWDPLVWDGVAQYLPWRIHLARSWRSGEIPLWNPYQFCGTPFVANGQSGCFYPPHVVLLIVEPALGVGLCALFHIWWAGLGMYILLRGLPVRPLAGFAGAAAFMFSGVFVGWLELASPLAVVSWMPWCVWSALQLAREPGAARAVAAGGAGAMALLAGHLNFALYVLGAAGVVFAAALIRRIWQRRSVRRLVGCGLAASALVGCFAAVQLLPTVELALLGHRPPSRPTVEGFQAARANALVPGQLGALLLPNALGRPADGDFIRVIPSPWGPAPANYAEQCGYAGLVAAVLAVVALGWRRDRFVWLFGGLALGGVLIATGSVVALIAYLTVPGFAQAGGFGRALCVYGLGISGLAALGLDHLMSRHPPATRQRTALLCGTSIVLVLAAAGLAAAVRLYATQSLTPPTDWHHPAARAAALAAGLLLSCGLVALAWRARGEWRAGGVVLAALVTIDALMFAYGCNPWGRREQLYADAEAVQAVRSIAEDERFLAITPQRAWSLWSEGLDPLLPPNAGLAYGLRSFQGYDSLYTARFKAFASWAQGAHPTPPENSQLVLIDHAASPLLDLAGVRAVLSYAPLNDPRLKPVWADRVCLAYRNEAALPLSFCVPGVSVVRDGKEAARLVQHRPQDLRRMAVVEPTRGTADRWQRLSGGTPGDPTPAESRWQGPNRIGIAARPTTAGALVVADGFYPGWRASVDGESVAVSCADYVFKAVPTDGRRHACEFVFFPESYAVGQFLGLAALLVVAAALVSGTRRRARRPTEPA